MFICKVSAHCAPVVVARSLAANARLTSFAQMWRSHWGELGILQTHRVTISTRGRCLMSHGLLAQGNN